MASTKGISSSSPARASGGVKRTRRIGGRQPQDLGDFAEHAVAIGTGQTDQVDPVELTVRQRREGCSIGEHFLVGEFRGDLG